MATETERIMLQLELINLEQCVAKNSCAYIPQLICPPYSPRLWRSMSSRKYDATKPTNLRRRYNTEVQIEQPLLR